MKGLSTSVLGSFLVFFSLVAFRSVASACPVQLTAAEVAKHGVKNDCWVIIEGHVYDITSYIQDHPTPPEVLLKSCGKDATQGWLTKGKKGQPHSQKAKAKLKDLLKGELVKTL